MTANRTARSFRTGRTPGRPRHTGQTGVFGRAPNVVLQAQKIFETVLSCAWTSSPTTVSYRSAAAFPAAPAFVSGAGLVALIVALGCPGAARSSARAGGDRRHAKGVRVPALPRPRDPEELRLVEGTTDELEPDREIRPCRPRGEGERGRTGERGRDREDVVQVHRERVVHLLAELEGGRRRRREEDRVDARERVVEILPDQRAHLHGAEIIRVV